MRTKAFRAAIDVTGFTYGDWCLANLKALAAIEEDQDLYARLSRDFVQSSSHRFSMKQRVPKAYPKMRRLGSGQQRLFFDVLCALAQSPLTPEADRNHIVRGMEKYPLTQPFLDSIRDNRANAFLPLLRRSTKDPELGGDAAALIAELTSARDKQLVAGLSVPDVTAAVLNMSGDTEEGRQLFTRQGCAACHSVLPDEPQKGPYLGTTGNLFNREQLITHVIDPAAEVAQGFQGFWFKLKDQSVVTGFVTGRDKDTIKLRNIAGLAQNISAGEVVEEGTLEGSMMPPGLVNTLTLGEFASLIDYLQSLH